MTHDKNAPNGGAFVADRPEDFDGWQILSATPMHNLAKALRVHMRKDLTFMTVYTHPDLLRVAEELHLTA